MTDTQTIASWTEHPYTSYDKRHITVEHRVRVLSYDGGFADVQHERRTNDNGKCSNWKEVSVAELRDTNNIQLYIANRMYRPSYISLHSAMAFHGFIPESIVQTTSVSTMKTKRFENSLGSFSYKKLKPQLFFGYTHLQFTKDKTILIATPEKSILDLLYLYPFYNTKNELLNLRLDEEMLHEMVQTDRFHEFLARFESKSLEKRADLFFNCYSI